VRTRTVTIRSLKEAMSYAGEWDELISASGADIYFKREWLSVWWAHFGQGRDLFFFLVYCDDNLVAFLPLYTEKHYPCLLPVRVARLAGPIHYFAVLKMPILRGYEQMVTDFLLDQALVATDSHAIVLSPLSGKYTDLLYSPETSIKPVRDTIVQNEIIAEHTVISLPNSFEEYMGGLSRKRRVKYRKSKERIETVQKIGTEVLEGAASAGFINEFITRHTAQWQTTGRAGHFGDWPDNAAFYYDLLERIESGNNARFYIQRDEKGEFVSAQFCLVHGTNCIALLTARDMSPEIAALGVGQYGQFERIQRLVQEGIAQIDSGTGLYAHKLSLGAEMIPVRRVILFENTLPSKIRVNALLVWAWFLDLVYYRIWFKKLAPRVRKLTGRRPRALWKSWIRTRF